MIEYFVFFVILLLGLTLLTPGTRYMVPPNISIPMIAFILGGFAAHKYMTSDFNTRDSR